MPWNEDGYAPLSLLCCKHSVFLNRTMERMPHKRLYRILALHRSGVRPGNTMDMRRARMNASSSSSRESATPPHQLGDVAPWRSIWVNTTSR